MKFPQFDLNKKSLAARLMVLLVGVAAMAISISAQKTFKSALAPEAIGVDIEQCANGPLAAPIHCNVSTGNDGYTRGNVNESKSHYFEGNSLPIRIVATGLTAAQTYTVTIGYDYTKGGKYATDYLTDYDRTESVMNDPCVGVTGCVLASETTFPIPLDPEVANGFDEAPGGGDDITQIPGSFSCFGCTITGVSGYTRSGDQSGDSSKTITITFTANQANIVIAYGAHISTRSDWGLQNSAINISGSPYHNFIVDFPGANSGSRDLQLSAAAVIFPAFITIEKTVVTQDVPPGTTSTFVFGFTSSGALFPSTSFSLVDSVAEPFSPVLTDRIGGTIDSSGITLFGSGNAITVTENDYSPIWSLAGITCTSTITNNNTINTGARSVSIVLEEGEFVKCSFHNTQLQPTAAPAIVSGRVTDSFGTGIGGARLILTDAQSGNSFTAMTNSFGYYTIGGVEIGNFYVLSVSHKRFTFADDTRAFTLNEDIAGMDFVANP
jgi:hypothetical protein